MDALLYARFDSLENMFGQVMQCQEDLPWQSVPGLLFQLHHGQFSGTLALMAKNVQTLVHFEDGTIVFVERGLPEHALGQILLRNGTITREQFDRVITRLTQSIVEKEGKRIGDCLIELGILGAEELDKALKDQMSKKLISCFRWRAPRFYLTQSNSRGAEFVDIKSRPLEQLILQGTKAYFDQDRLQNMLVRIMDSYPYLTEQGKTRACCFGLSDSELRFIVSLTGERPIEAIITNGSLPPSRSLQLLAALCFTRSVSLFAEPASNGEVRWNEDQTPADPAPVEHARVDQAQMGRLIMPPREREHSEAMHNERKPRPDVVAQRSFWEGKRLLKSNKLEQALDRFREAADQDRHEEKYKLFSLWTEYLIGQEGQTNQKLKSLLRDQARKVLSKDKYHAKAHLVIGHLHRLEKRVDEALYHLQLAKQMDPSEPLVRKELRGLMQKE